jgi:hypothetical protein
MLVMGTETVLGMHLINPNVRGALNPLVFSDTEDVCQRGTATVFCAIAPRISSHRQNRYHGRGGPEEAPQRWRRRWQL